MFDRVHIQTFDLAQATELKSIAQSLFGSSAMLKLAGDVAAPHEGDVAAIAREIRRAGGGLVGLVGAQSNQFPRSINLARQLRA